MLLARPTRYVRTARVFLLAIVIAIVGFGLPVLAATDTDTTSVKTTLPPRPVAAAAPT